MPKSRPELMSTHNSGVVMLRAESPRGPTPFPIATASAIVYIDLLGLQAPGFAHCPLLLAPDGRRLSKRDGDQSLENLREKYTAQEIVGKLAYAYGLQPEPAPRTPESLIKDFSWAKVPKRDVCLPEDLF